MKIGFISLPVFGHLNPMTALARELRSRQHDVVFISLLDTEPFVRRIAGLAFVPCCEKDLPLGAMKGVAQQISLRQGPEALAFTLRAIASMTDSLLDSLPGILERAEIDALVLDTYHFIWNWFPSDSGCRMRIYQMRCTLITLVIPRSAFMIGRTNARRKP
jgi:zeaxanthin glucosyltransferase